MYFLYLNSTEDFQGSYTYNVKFAEASVSLIKSF